MMVERNTQAVFVQHAQGTRQLYLLEYSVETVLHFGSSLLGFGRHLLFLNNEDDT